MSSAWPVPARSSVLLHSSSGDWCQNRIGTQWGLTTQGTRLCSRVSQIIDRSRVAADGMTWIFPPDYFMCSVVVWISFLFKKRKIWKDRVRDIDVVDRKALVVHAVWSILKLCFLKKEKKKQITTCRGSSQNNGYRRNWHPVPSNNRPGRERHGLFCCRQPLPARYIYSTVLYPYILYQYTLSPHIYTWNPLTTSGWLLENVGKWKHVEQKRQRKKQRLKWSADVNRNTTIKRFCSSSVQSKAT